MASYTYPPGAERGQNEAARLVVSVRSLILHLYVVRVTLVRGQFLKRAQVEPVVKYVTCSKTGREHQQ